MESNGEIRSESVVLLNGAEGAAIIALAADVRAAVDQLEIDCCAQRIGQETVARIHELRERAEQIFQGFE